jgi:hypothetical protein
MTWFAVVMALLVLIGIAVVIADNSGDPWV